MNHRDHQSLPHVLVSACLLGEPTRYDGGHMKCDHPKLEEWLQEGRILSICPEVEGGLPTPRTSAEIFEGDGEQVLDEQSSVRDVNSRDVTRQYRLGAQKTLQVAQENGVRVAILKARSPSCGSKFIYDGTFSVKIKPGKGVTAALLEREGIRVFNEEEIEEVEKFLQANK